MKKEFRILGWVFICIFFILGCFEVLLAAGYPWKYSSLEPYLLRKKNDNWTHNGFEIQRIKQAVSSKNNKEVIVFLGGSVGLEAITSDEEMSQMLSDRLDRPVLFRSLCSSYKTFSDEIKIIEELGSLGANSTIIFNTEILRFKTTNDKQLVNFLKETEYEHLKYYFLPTSTSSSAIFDEHNIEVGIKHRVRIFRTSMVFGEIFKKKIYRFFFARQRFKSVHDRHTADSKKPVDEKQQAKLSKILDSMLEDIAEVYKVNYQFFRAAIDKAHLNGYRVILADTPTNPLFDDQLEAFTPKYNKLIQDLVQEDNNAYLDLRDAADWKPEDFRDLHHMLPSGREKYTAILVEKLVQLNL
jgi:hypothetical protein